MRRAPTSTAICTFGFDANNQLTPRFSGDAKILMGPIDQLRRPFRRRLVQPDIQNEPRSLIGSIDPAYQPTQNADDLLDHFGLDADSFLHGVLGDVVSTIRKFTKPIEPFVDFLQTQVPIMGFFGKHETFAQLVGGRGRRIAARRRRPRLHAAAFSNCQLDRSLQFHGRRRGSNSARSD